MTDTLYRLTDRPDIVEQLSQHDIKVAAMLELLEEWGVLVKVEFDYENPVTFVDCPSLARVTDAAKARWGIGGRLQGGVNPLGVDVCMICVHRWKRPKGVRGDVDTLAGGVMEVLQDIEVVGNDRDILGLNVKSYTDWDEIETTLRRDERTET